MSGPPLTVLRLLSLRHFGRHRLRTALAIASVSLGVATFLGMVALNRGVLESFAHTARMRAAGADWVLRGGRAGIERELADAARAVPGVRAAVPMVARVLEVTEPVQARLLLIGLDPESVPTDADLLPRAAIAELASPVALLFGGTPLLLPEPLARDLGLEAGSALEVATPSGPRRAVVAGTIAAEGLFAAYGAAVAGARLEDAMALTSTGTRVDRVQVFLEAGADAAAAGAALSAAVAGRAELVDPAGLAREYDANLGSFRLALQVVSLLSLLIAAFLVHSTLAMALAERRRELSLARCLGLTARGLRGLLGLEAAVLGGIGAALGVPLGRLLASGMSGVFWDTVGSTFDRIDVRVSPPSPLENALGLAAGLVAALIAVLPAAWRAGREAPLAGLVSARTEERTGRPVLRLALAAVLVAGAAALFATDGGGIERAGYWTAIALVAAIALGAHPLLGIVLRGSGPRILGWLGPAGRLARDHCERSVGPTSLTVVAISLGFGLVYSTDVMVKSYVRMIDRWFGANVGEDLIVMGTDFIESGLQGVSFDAAFADELRALPGVLHVHAVRMSRIPFEGDRVLLFAYDAAAPPEAGAPTFVEGGPADRTALARGEGAFVSEGFARRFGRRRGDRVDLPAPGGRISLPVLAVVEDYTWPRGSIWIDQRFYARAFADDEVQEFAITADGTRPLADLRADVEAAVRPRFAATVVETATLLRDVKRIIEQFWTLLLAQEGIAVTVAFLGSLHTLLISVLLRRREIALLRALGAPLSMVRSMLRIEGLLLGLAGGAIGVLFGVAAGAIALRMLSLEEQGFAVAVRPSPWMALGTLAAASFTGWLAGVIPGRRAALAAPRSALLDTMA